MCTVSCGTWQTLYFYPDKLDISFIVFVFAVVVVVVLEWRIFFDDINFINFPSLVLFKIFFKYKILIKERHFFIRKKKNYQNSTTLAHFFCGKRNERKKEINSEIFNISDLSHSKMFERGAKKKKERKNKLRRASIFYGANLEEAKKYEK